ncbi:MAG: ankyrin repeat domain-containing protein [Akkermansiaceae bacterium]|nr:ankyrin repeat domain-containing protein [Armatimonadota bacterium]
MSYPICFEKDCLRLSRLAAFVVALTSLTAVSHTYAQAGAPPQPPPVPAAPGNVAGETPAAVVRDPAADANLLYYAAQGDLTKFQRFLQRGGSVQEARRQDGKTVLMLAANRGSLPIVQLALKENADVNAADKIGMSALMLASRAGHAAIVAELIKSGASVENKNVNGMTALSLAVQAQKPEVVSQLLAGSASVATKDNWGNTPLMLAASGDPGIVQSLLKAGADVKARNSIGKTALGIAVAKKNEGAAAQLRAAGGFE